MTTMTACPLLIGSNQSVGLWTDSFGLSNVHCVWAFWPFANFELNRIPISNLSSHLGLVNEEVFSIFSFDKAEALYLIKQLYCAT